MRGPTELFEQLKNFLMSINFGAFGCAHSVKNHSERALCGNAWIEMFQRTGGGIPRIGEQWQFGGFALLIKFFEAGLVEISFAAHFEDFWSCAGQLVWYRFDRLDVLGDVVADRTVAARRGVPQFAVFIHH